MSNIKDKLFTTLKDKPRVITRAAFWKIPHNTQPDEVALKVGRYNKPKNWLGSKTPETLKPKSELTLDNDELDNLVSFLQEHYEPFKAGVKAFIPLDDPFNQSSADQIRALFSLPNKKQLIQFILSHHIIPEELELGLMHAKRIKAISNFKTMLDNDLVESDWQKWFENNDWVLGSDFIRVLDERTIDTQNISDFLMAAYDGFLDVIEVKRPEGGMLFWARSMDHGNYVPSSNLIKAVTQASSYIYEIEREANSVKFLERVDGVKTVKPRCILIFGRSNDWDVKQSEAFRILNAGYHNLTIMTYDHVLDRAKRIVGIEANKGLNLDL